MALFELLIDGVGSQGVSVTRVRLVPPERLSRLGLGIICVRVCDQTPLISRVGRLPALARGWQSAEVHNESTGWVSLTRIGVK